MNRYLAKYLFYYPVTTLKGEFVAAYLKDYRKFQNLPLEEIQVRQVDRFNQLLDFVSKENAFYKKRYSEQRVPRKISSLVELRDFPTISKQDLIASIEELSSSSTWFSSTKTTGGSTGEPVKLKKSASALSRERAATWRAYEWAGVGIGDAQGRFWGVPHSAIGRVKASITDFVSNRIRLSAFQITEENLRRYYDRFCEFRPVYLYGYVSAINALAEFVIAEGLSPLPGLRSVITTSEVLTEAVRKNVEKAFCVPVFNEYGCGEVGSIAHECSHGRLHLMADNLIVEVDADPGCSGEIIVTDLFNTATPLIRYRLGDYATLSNEKCTCGVTLPVISGVHGRAYDLIKTPSGRVIHPEALIYVFETIQQRTGLFKQFQAIQVSRDEIKVKLIPASSIGKPDIDLITANLARDVDEQIRFSVEVCDHIGREPSGKMRLVKSLVE